MTSKQEKVNLYNDVKGKIEGVLNSLPNNWETGLNGTLKKVLKDIDNSIEKLTDEEKDEGLKCSFPFTTEDIIEVLTEHSGYSGWDGWAYEAGDEDIYMLKEDVAEKDFPPLNEDPCIVFEISREPRDNSQLAFLKLIVGGGYVTGMHASSCATVGFPVSTYDKFMENLKKIDS